MLSHDIMPYEEGEDGILPLCVQASQTAVRRWVSHERWLGCVLWFAEGN